MVIPFNTKFCEQNLDNYLQLYWDNSLHDDHGEVIFDLSILEWINLEEIAFLFGWIRNLKLKEKVIIIILPYQYDIFLSVTISQEVKSIRDSMYDMDTEEQKERRERLSLILLSIWGMMSSLGLRDLDFKNIIEDYNNKEAKIKKSIFSHKVIPFTVLDSSIGIGQRIIVDFEFEKALNGEKTLNKTNGNDDKELLFKINEEIRLLLNRYSCFSPFESKIISHVLTKELFINSIEHSDIEECYFTTSLSNKWHYTSSERFIDHFTKERDIDTIDFFKDKDIILREIKREYLKLSRINFNNLPIIREANIKKFNSDFKNLSYLEFTFLDFGKGIYETLNEGFHKNKIDIKPLMSENFETNPEHSQILEYAFLMESSKNPYDREIEYSEFIPRGLYFLIDMVRRFKGLLVARSGFGKVIYDFSDKIIVEKKNQSLSIYKDRVYSAREAIRKISNPPSFFAGTMVSIMLPERPIEKLKRSSVRIDDKILNHYIFNMSMDEYYPKDIFEPKLYDYISMAFLYQEALTSLSAEDLNDKVIFENFIFKKIDKKLNDLKGISSVLFIDFEFLYERSNYIKIISWLTNTPKVNEFTKVIIVNLTAEESSVIREFKENFDKKSILNETDFLYKPIPCVRFNKPLDQDISIDDIDWVGVRDRNDEALLTNLFFGIKENYPSSHFKNPWVTEGHVFSKFQGNTYTIFKSFHDLVLKYKNAKLWFTGEWIIKNEIKDGENPKSGKNKHVFLTSGGMFQNKYISLYETLHNKYISKFFAKLLLDNYIKKKLEIEEENSDISFNKIIVVTVCSQLIGVGIRDLIRYDPLYSFLKLTSPKAGQNQILPKLIRLTSYFSFDTEKPFEEITDEDKIIIVNDVISTGSLIQRLITGIENKNAKINSILTIVDNRLINETGNVLPNTESLIFSDYYEENIISLLSSSKESELKIEKSRVKPGNGYDIKRINPILNTVVELSYEHSEKARVLFEDVNAFITEDFCNAKMFRIGHIKQGLTHNSYYTDMVELFQNENGKKVLNKLKQKIETNIEQHKLTNEESNLIYLRNIINNLNHLNFKTLHDTEYLNENISLLRRSVEELVLKLENREILTNQRTLAYTPDFIFHPVFSGIEEVSDITFKEVFRTEVDNIVGLQRYNTRNGWRFPFPAKRYNKLTKGKHILIIDSGTLTGDSLVQLIDSISFLEVGRIDFLSVIGRIDDFQREFYSRLKSIKVKNLVLENEEKRSLQPIINLNILFGVNMNIPPYSAKNVCPFCQEFDLLESYSDRFKKKGFPDRTSRYIEKRLNREIKLVENRDDINTILYLPIDSKTNNPDYKNIFIMRDKIGKVDSYRFYGEYFTPFDEMTDKIKNDVFENKENLRDFELVLICILHEPSLFGVIKDLLVNVYKTSEYIIDKIISENSIVLTKLNYIWSKYAILRLYVTLKGIKLYDENTFKRLLDFSVDDEYGLDYLSFLLSEGFFELNKNKDVIRKTHNILEYLMKHITKEKENIFHLIRSITQYYEQTDVRSIHDAFDNLKKFLLKEDSKNTPHSELENAFSALTRNIINPKFIKDKIDDIKKDITFIINIIKEGIFKNLVKIKQEEYLKNCYERVYNEIFGTNSVYTEIDYLLKELEKINYMKEDSPEFLFEIEELANRLILFQFKFLNLADKKNNSFIQFCLGYKADLKLCIRYALESNIVKKYFDETPNIIINNQISSLDLLVDIHNELLKNALIEVIINACKFAKSLYINDPSEKVILTFNVEQPEGGQFEFIMEQDKPFLNPNNIRRGTKDIIERVFVAFYGLEKFKVIINPTYKLKVKLS